MSRETTFDRDLHAVRDKVELGAIFTELCQQLAQDLQRKGYVGRTIGVKLRFDDFTGVTRDHSIEGYTQDAQALRHAAGLALKRAPLKRRLRLLGVRVGALITQQQWDLEKNQSNSACVQHLPSLLATTSGAYEAAARPHKAVDLTPDLFDL